MTTSGPPPRPFCRHCDGVIYRRADGMWTHSNGRVGCPHPHRTNAEPLE